jgi:hypothetical protein
MRVYFYIRNDEGCLQEDVITLAGINHSKKRQSTKG